ncbi:MAG: VOC family protein [Acidimicrobiia bacterium]
MATKLLSVGIDAHDPVTLAGWWAEALGWTVTEEEPDEAVVEPRDDGLYLVFLAVPEPKTVKNRVHLDLGSDDLDAQRETVDRLVAMGAGRVDVGQGDVPWVVLADPEGNEFCVLDPRDRYQGAGSLVSVVVDAGDPAALARFWAEATGWTVGFAAEGVMSLHHPSDRPPDVDFVRVADPKRSKNRVHLDVVAPNAKAVVTEASRLVARGACPVDVGQVDVPWIVLADPEGNELCVVPPDA